MNDYKKSVKLTFIMINISIILLFVLAIALPWLTTWYVEIRHKDAGLPALIMLICYPSLPFAATALFSLRAVLKNLLNGLIFCDRNITALQKTFICCIGGAVITFAAGFFYLPFFVVSISALGCAVIIKTIKDIFAAGLSEKSEKSKNFTEDKSL